MRFKIFLIEEDLNEIHVKPLGNINIRTGNVPKLKDNVYSFLHNKTKIEIFQEPDTKKYFAIINQSPKEIARDNKLVLLMKKESFSELNQGKKVEDLKLEDLHSKVDEYGKNLKFYIYGT